MHDLRRWSSRHGASLALAALLASIAWSLLLPLYTDEVAWRFLLSRVTQDGGVDRWVGETCGANVLAYPPTFMLPLRHMSAWLTSAFPDPRWVRVAGVTIAGLAVVLTRTLIGLIEKDAARRSTLRIAVFLMLGLGVLPLMLTWSRPEQPIWIALLVSSIIALRNTSSPPSSARALWSVAAITVVTTWTLGYHVKALFYLPVFVTCLWIAGAGSDRRWPRLVATGLIGVLAAIAYGYWAARFQCPDDAVLRAKLDGENISSTLLRSGLGGAMAAVPQIVLNANPVRYVFRILPADWFMSSWLTPVQAPHRLLLLWRWSILAAWGAVAGTALWAVWLIIRRRLFRDPRLYIAVAITVSLLAWGAVQSNKNAYESSLYLPMLLVVVALVVAVARVDAMILRRLLYGLVPLFVVSQTALFAQYTPRLYRLQQRVGYIPDQPWSIPVWSFARYRERAIAAGAKCGISPARPNRRLLVDDASYFIFADSYRPLHYTGVTGPWIGKITDPATYLRTMRSSGAVLGCRQLDPWPRSRALAIATGDICCIAPQR